MITGREGKQVPVADTVRGFKEILDGGKTPMKGKAYEAELRHLQAQLCRLQETRSARG
jgi:F0F1-type ATP synthase beta subunit